MPDIRLATADDLETLAATVVAAFDHDPAFRAFFGPGPEFGPMALAFATDLLRRRIATESVWMTGDGDALAMWDPPAGSVETPASTLELPADARARLDEYDARVHAAIIDEPHWYLGVLASHPRRRGEGLARIVAQAALDAAAAAGLPAVLETTNPDNVAMYERSGWRTTAELPDVIGLAVWILQRD
ncbi:MAG: GNAT family N-acetyltransferase [Actinomycetota bacterium]